jgi:hypothetical protein
VHSNKDTAVRDAAKRLRYSEEEKVCLQDDLGEGEAALSVR